MGNDGNPAWCPLSLTAGGLYQPSMVADTTDLVPHSLAASTELDFPFDSGRPTVATLHVNASDALMTHKRWKSLIFTELPIAAQSSFWWKRLAFSVEQYLTRYPLMELSQEGEATLHFHHKL